MSSVRRSAIGIQHAAVEVVAAVMPSVYARRIEPEKNATNVQSVCTDETAMCGVTRIPAPEMRLVREMDRVDVFQALLEQCALSVRRVIMVLTAPCSAHDKILVATTVAAWKEERANVLLALLVPTAPFVPRRVVAMCFLKVTTAMCARTLVCGIRHALPQADASTTELANATKMFRQLLATTAMRHISVVLARLSVNQEAPVQGTAVAMGRAPA